MLPPVVIQSDQLVLGKTLEESLPAIVEMEVTDKDYIIPYSPEQHRQVMYNEDEMHISIVRLSDQQIIGFIILAGLSNAHKSLEFRRIVISGKGYGRESLRLVKKYCFKQLKFHRLWLDVFEDNHRAGQLYRSEQFREEGILRECIWHSHRYRSLIVLSILENEYSPV